MSDEKFKYMEEIRPFFGIDEDDESCDEEIMAMDPDLRMRMAVGWYYGDEGWLDAFHEYLKSRD